MKSVIIRFLTAVVGLSLSFGAFANEYPQIWIDCSAKPDNNAEFLEYLGSQDYCYRIKVRCDQGLFGGFQVEVNTDDGGVGLGASIDDANGAFCFMSFGHLDNSGFSHACDFDIGKAELDVKAVHGKKCVGTSTDPLCLGDQFCDDGNQCTVDICSPVFGCSNEPDLGAICDDGNSCTINDACDHTGSCISGAHKDCSDGLSCTVDSCNPFGGDCTNTLVDNTCLINSVCYALGDPNPSDSSRSCQPAIDPYNWSDNP